MKKIINWFKGIELYQVAIGIFLGFVAFIAILIPVGMYKECINHYDIKIKQINGEERVIHCRSYCQKDNCIRYNVNDDYFYINLDSVLMWSICSVECDCNKV